jgi:hypothetical protein
MTSNRRVTRWTDTRGVPRQDLRGLFEITWLARFEAAGIPKAWLHRSGAFAPFGSEAWESEGDLEGCFADALYVTGQCLQGLTDGDNSDPSASDRLRATVDLMGRLGSKVSCGPVVSEFRDSIRSLIPDQRRSVQDGYEGIQKAWDAVAGETPYEQVLANPELYARCRETVKPLWREQLKRVVATNVANCS